jgi:hypothetical protein
LRSLNALLVLPVIIVIVLEFRQLMISKYAHLAVFVLSNHQFLNLVQVEVLENNLVLLMRTSVLFARLVNTVPEGERVSTGIVQKVLTV